MKRAFYLLLVLVVFAGLTNAQSKISLGVGGTLAVPLGTFADISSVGGGGLVQGEMSLGPVVGTASIGYVAFGSKDVLGSGVKNTTSAVPVLVGAKYSFSPLFYGSAELGLNFISTKVETPASSGTLSTNDFVYAVGVGVNLSTIDLSLKYQALNSSSNYIGVNALYFFGL